MHFYIGWDIGGAHLKAACVSSAGEVKAVLQLPCPLWQGMHHLESALVKTMAQFGDVCHATNIHHALTMTGEMADCFNNRNEGVVRILETVRNALPDSLSVYCIGDSLYDCFVNIDIAIHNPNSIASANWHATANYVANFEQSGLLIDIGSTTTDIIPFKVGKLATQAKSDSERLSSGELVYTGIMRTPIMAVASELTYRGHPMPIVAEAFANMADVYRISGAISAQDDQHPTCDNTEKTPVASMRRLARMFGYDYKGEDSFWIAIANLLINKQQQTVESACIKVHQLASMTTDISIIGAGRGRFLAKSIAQNQGWQYKDYACLLSSYHIANSEEITDCASAVSVAYLKKGLE